MSITRQIRSAVLKALQDLYKQSFTEKDFQVNQTKPEFEGDYTVVLFSLVKQLKKSPDAIGNELGQKLVEDNPDIFASFNLIKGFLNLVLHDSFWSGFLQQQAANGRFGMQEPTGEKVMVEYSSPNTNKPLHVGHLRNNFLGWSVAAIYRANGADVVKTCIVNDRGIHICKSMIAWELFANGATPELTGIKGRPLCGRLLCKIQRRIQKASPATGSLRHEGRRS